MRKLPRSVGVGVGLGLLTACLSITAIPAVTPVPAL
jgi:uncharacterized membrane protein YcjF (UPF0283 family)